MKVEIVPAEAEHITAIAPKVREADRQELWATACMKPIDALICSYAVSKLAWTGLVDGEPVCMFGVAPASLLTSTGRPWMIGTDLIDRYSTTFLRRCKGRVREMLRYYQSLENYVDLRNERAIRWLDWLGFEFEGPYPYGVLKLPFMRFTMER